MALGRTNISLPEIPLPIHEIVVTQDVINEGTFYNGSHTILTGQQNGSDGFTLVGRRAKVAGTAGNVSEFVCWVYQMNVTDYSEITFYARKNANHGIVQVVLLRNVTDNVVVDNELARCYVHYDALPTSWTQYTLDISNVTGEVCIAFIGGYTDQTVNTTSSTSYCDIHIA